MVFWRSEALGPKARKKPGSFRGVASKRQMDQSFDHSFARTHTCTWGGGGNSQGSAKIEVLPTSVRFQIRFRLGLHGKSSSSPSTRLARFAPRLTRCDRRIASSLNNVLQQTKQTLWASCFTHLGIIHVALFNSKHVREALIINQNNPKFGKFNPTK